MPWPSRFTFQMLMIPHKSTGCQDQDVCTSRECKAMHAEPPGWCRTRLHCGRWKTVINRFHRHQQYEPAYPSVSWPLSLRV